MTDPVHETMLRGSVISFPFLHITIDPPASFHLFGRDFYLYGAIIALAFLAGIIYCTRKSKHCGIPQDDIYDILLYLIPLCILGARFYFVLFQLEYYLQHPGEILAVWEGGLAVYGGIITGAITLLLFCKKRKLPVLAVMDLFITACILGQSIGRWGNFTNREAFGVETELFCRMGLMDASGSMIYVHPTFLYESLWNLIGFLLLNVLLSGKKQYDGECIYVYCAWYGLGRTLIEGLRTDSLYLWNTGIRVSQLLSFLLFLFGIVILILNRKNTVLFKMQNTETDSQVFGSSNTRYGNIQKKL